MQIAIYLQSIFDMRVTPDYILKTLCLPKISRKKAFKLFNSLNYSLSDDNEWSTFLSEKASEFQYPKYSKSDYDSAIKKTYDILDKSEKLNIKQISYYDKNFPILLKNSIDSPILLNYIGDFNILNSMPSIAIIGTREPSEYGFQVGMRMSSLFANFGFNIISGLATGCDTAGHKGALSNNGKTTAILAHGLDKIYPKENKMLAAEILEKDGLLISEYPVGQTPFAGHFVERDRIQAWLSLGIFVVETDIKGGTMHTVKFAEKADRIISTLNHPPEKHDHPKVNGNQFLINERIAIPIATKNDVESLRDMLIEKFNNLSQKEQPPISKPDDLFSSGGIDTN